jgi:hypothetical protein
MKARTGFVAILLLIGVSIAGGQDPGKKDAPEVAVAKTHIQAIDTALQAYRVKNDKFPEGLDKLTEGEKPFLKRESLIDPWKKPYQYEATGPKNDGKKPDVWTVTPDKKTLGNWPEKK